LREDKKGSEILGFSDKLQTERAVFFCLSFPGKKNKRAETDTEQVGSGRRPKREEGKEKKKSFESLLSPRDTSFVRSSLECCFDCCH
jgi:hypothetical protein